jgi:hypothetical protein
MEYKVVKAEYLHLLVDLVDKSLSEGWKLQGGVCVTYLPSISGDRITNSRNEMTMFYQAMFKEEKE